MALVMGVLNVTPDSFYDGGRWADEAAAVGRGREMVPTAGPIVDVGGESTRPNACPWTRAPTRAGGPRSARTGPEADGRARISVDTRKRAVAEAAIEAGATIVNDVSASLWRVAAEAGTGWVAMHMKGEPSDMMRHASYGDVVTEVKEYLVDVAERAKSEGVKEIWIDPGIGFAKTTAHNLAVLAHLDQLVATGWPVAVAVSRKRFTGAVTSGGEGSPTPSRTVWRPRWPERCGL